MTRGLILLGALLAGQAAFAQPVTANMEAVIRTLNLTDVATHPDDKGADASGTLPDGVRIELDFHRDGSLEEIEADRRNLFPISALVALLPVTLTSDARLAGAMVEQIEFDDDGIEIEGRDRDGNAFKAEYSASGQLQEWKRD